MKLGLESIRKLLAVLGNPEKNYLKVQIAGTNGKGSVCAFLNSVCLASGIRTGMYTSPHLASITERVQIDGMNISEDDFAKYATRVRSTAESLVARGLLTSIPTFFEQVTAIALIAFADAEVELAILETGLGGRLDATTAANAEIAAITRIDLDHQKYLGDTIEEIAAEKAAIIHEGSRVVVGEQFDAAMKVILERCREAGVAPQLVSEVVAKEFEPPPFADSARAGFGTTDHHPRRRVFPQVTFVTPQGVYQGITLGIAGRHQIENSKVAILLAENLRERFSISDESLMRGLTMARHPGRLEFMGPFLLDGAHNVGGALVLRAFLDEFVNGTITIVFGSMQDKNLKDVGNILFPMAERLILTQSANSRSRSPEDLLDAAQEYLDRDRVSLADSVEEALQTALGRSPAANHLVLVTGSLYLVGEARRILQDPTFGIGQNFRSN